MNYINQKDNTEQKAFNEDILTLPFDKILLQVGYDYKKEKCSRNFITMTNNNNDLVVITRQPNNQYLYFNPNDENDRGNIYSFCKNRKIKLYSLLNEEIKNINTHNIEPSSINKASMEAVNNYKNFNPISDENNFNRLRLISNSILKQFSTIKQDKHNNICVPTYSLDKYENNVFVNLTGYIAYLRTPLFKDKNGNNYDKAIKHLCYGAKGLEIIKSQTNKQKLQDIKNIIISESIIDTLSLVEIKKYDLNDTLLCATNGQITKSHKDLFKYFNDNSKAKITLAFDNDNKGNDFLEKTKTIFNKLDIQIDKPILKDFNDDLIVMKILNLNNNFNLDDINDKFKQFNKKIQYMLDKKDIIMNDSKNQLLKDIKNDYSILKHITPKLQNYINTTELFNKYSKIIENSISNNKTY